MTDTTEAQQRVQTYIDRRKQSRGLDKDHIHGFDAGESSEAILLTSDLEVLIGEIQQFKAERASQTNRAAAAEQQVTALTQRLDMANRLNIDAREQLAQLSARQAVPDGWRLVPMEPTEEMIKAGNTKTWVLPCHDCWSAMLSAAPPPPEREPLPVQDGGPSPRM
ncbi:hypothetical protein [Comamonas odontotermitis]|uniref:hypothetical protein n=1 Tax=Comamonas odontotermitis TaxID=379895 RepID=UPI001CC6146A|nr:hypothetical protein [Comamonas odontotermitis]UBB18313.1 hypothetical protein LAD35_06660 [Comamonas odontotermitis]